MRYLRYATGRVNTIYDTLWAARMQYAICEYAKGRAINEILHALTPAYPTRFLLIFVLGVVLLVQTGSMREDLMVGPYMWRSAS